MLVALIESYYVVRLKPYRIHQLSQSSSSTSSVAVSSMRGSSFGGSSFFLGVAFFLAGAFAGSSATFSDFFSASLAASPSRATSQSAIVLSQYSSAAACLAVSGAFSTNSLVLHIVIGFKSGRVED